MYVMVNGKKQFLSTPSVRRATSEPVGDPAADKISIHALREEGDRLRQDRPLPCAISIHALREEGDLRGRPVGAVRRIFLSTPSVRRAT